MVLPQECTKKNCRWDARSLQYLDSATSLRVFLDFTCCNTPPAAASLDTMVQLPLEPMILGLSSGSLVMALSSPAWTVVQLCESHILFTSKSFLKLPFATQSPFRSFQLHNGNEHDSSRTVQSDCFTKTGNHFLKSRFVPTVYKKTRNNNVHFYL